MLNIINQAPYRLGGAVTYVAHLARVLGDNARVIRIGARTERNPRKGALDFKYQIFSLEDVMDLDGPLLLAAGDPHMPMETVYTLLKRPDFWRVFHDPNEFKLYPHWPEAGCAERVVAIRETGLVAMPKATLIPHPYASNLDASTLLPAHERPKHAVSTARTSTIKNSDVVLEANATLPLDRRVELLGEVERWFRLKHPELGKGRGYPVTFNGGHAFLRDAYQLVDLTVFKDDGGGTQYTFLEAMDCGCRIIAHSKWLSYPGPMKRLAIGVSNAEELAAVLARDPEPYDPAPAWEYLQTNHDSSKIAASYMELTHGV